MVVGVTGSIAKTSTKEQIAQVLAQRWTVLRNQANENNEIGLPLTLLRLAPTDDVAVLEMGMYTPGDIAVLAELAQPRIGVVTAVRPTHLARAGSIDAIERGKRELVEALPVGGTAVLNADDERVTRMADHALGSACRSLRLQRHCRCAATESSRSAITGCASRSRRRSTRQRARIPALGRHSRPQRSGCGRVGHAPDSTPDDRCRPRTAIQRPASDHAGSRRRLADPRRQLQRRARLDGRGTRPAASLPGRRIAVLGEMLELGDLSDEAHREVGAARRAAASCSSPLGRTSSLYGRARAMRV